MNQEILSKYLKLQNGSDVRGIAIEGIEGEHVNLTVDIVCNIAAAFADYLSRKYNKEMSELVISVGHDSRITAETLKTGVLEGIRLQGAKAIDCSLASTPSLFMSTILPELNYDGGIMITASHLPFNRNGMKFFTKDGGLEKSDIKELLTKAVVLEENGILEHETQSIEKVDLLAHYSANLRQIICQETGISEDNQPLSGLHFVVDAGNGAGGFFATQVLEPLGANISGSIYLEPDGTFPNHIPNPENAKAMEAIRNATLENHADLGIIFDTDVDRAATVLANGMEINRNTLIALMGAIVAKTNPGSTVVTDSVTSDQLTEFLEGKLGLVHHRFKRGYRNVINESIRLNENGIESCLAIETSGHGALKENYFLDDGAYMSVKILCEAVKCKQRGESISDLLNGFEEPADSKELRIHIRQEQFKEYGLMVLDEFKEFAKQEETFHIVNPNYEGVRISFDDEEVKGWLLLRMSLHDPLLPMNIEANKEGGVQIILERVKPFFSRFEHLENPEIR